MNEIDKSRDGSEEDLNQSMSVPKKENGMLEIYIIDNTKSEGEEIEANKSLGEPSRKSIE